MIKEAQNIQVGQLRGGQEDFTEKALQVSFGVRSVKQRRRWYIPGRENSICIGMRWEKTCHTWSQVLKGYLLIVGRVLEGDEALL